MDQFINTLVDKKTEIVATIGILGFLLGLTNLFIKLKEIKESPHIILRGLGGGDVEEIIKGNFYKDTNRILNGQLNPNYKVKEGELYFNLIYTNRGVRPLHIISQRIYIRDRTLNHFFIFELEHSTDFEKIDIGGKKYKRYNAYHETIILSPFSSVSKHYLIPIQSGATLTSKPRFFEKGDIYLAFQSSNGKSYYQKLY
jgi:hypothetical protein